MQHSTILERNSYSNRGHFLTASKDRVKRDEARRIAANVAKLRELVRGFRHVLSITRPGFIFPVAVFVKAHRGSQKGIVVAKTPVKLTIGIASIAAVTWFGTSYSRAYGDAP
jgi:hypothetical protein